MKTYSEYTDPCLRLDRQDWLVAPTCRSSIFEPIVESNFVVALNFLGGEGINVEVHKFSQGYGWFELIFIRPDTPEVRIGEIIESRLEEYPVLDGDDLSMRELEL